MSNRKTNLVYILAAGSALRYNHMIKLFIPQVCEDYSRAFATYEDSLDFQEDIVSKNLLDDLN